MHAPPIWALRISDGHCVNMFFVPVTLTFDLVTWKSIGVICQSWSIFLSSFMILGISVLELSSGNHFTISGHRDLDLWPSDLKSIGVNCESWSIYIWSFMIIGQSVLELSSDNHLKDGPTDRPTDRPTDMSKAIYPLFFEGGHKNRGKVSLE
jgi:hypothetical protein